MNRAVKWTYSIPSVAPVATVFCLHGRNGNHTTVFNELHLHDLVAAARLPLTIASIDGGDDNYYHKRKDGTDALSMIIKEFIPLIDNATHTTKRALLGWSMGGYGSLLAGERFTDMFSAIVAFSSRSVDQTWRFRSGRIR